MTVVRDPLASIIPLAGARAGGPRPNGHVDPEPVDEDELHNAELDAIAERETEARPSVVDRATAFVRVYGASEFLALQIAPSEWLVRGIWREHSIGWIGGAPKTLKSHAAIELAKAVTTGAAFLAQHAVPARRRVLLAQFESSLPDFQHRLARAFAGVAIPEELYVVSNAELVLEDDASAARFAAVIDDVQPALVIIDPLASCTLGDENSAQEMGRVVRRLRSWRDRYGCAIAVVHHVQKSREAAASRGGVRLRGSSALHAASECAMWLDRADDTVPRVSVRLELKEAPTTPPFDVELGEDGQLRLVESGQVTDEQLVDAVASKGYTTAAVVATFFAKAETGMKRRLDALVKSGRLGSLPGAGTKATTYKLADPERIARTVQNTWSAERSE